MTFSSVRFRLTLWNVGILALALVVVLVAVNIAVRSYMLANIDQRLEGMSERFLLMQARRAVRREPERPRESERTPDSDRERLFRATTSRWMRVYDMQEQAMTRNWQPAETQELPWDRAAYAHAVNGAISFSTVTGEDAPLRVHTRPIIRDGEQVGVVQAVFSLRELEVLLDGLTMILIILVPCVLLLAGIGGLFLTKRALNPVRAMMQAADAFNAEDLSYRLPVAGTDEFAQLAQTVNQMLARLQDAFTQLQQSVERERQFTADASHELRTPLTAIKANASLALRSERTPEQYREALAAIRQASETMQHLVQDLLLLARADSGQLAVTYAAVDPRALLETAVQMLRHRDDAAAIAIHVAAGIPPIHGDEHQLQRLLTNLLDNALRHTPPSGTIDLEAIAQQGRIIITVADTGEGIAPEHLPHLGERFYRIDAARTRQHGGVGLGLAICKSIVDAHHGAIAFRSTPGHGTRVTVTLPMAEA